MSQTKINVDYFIQLAKEKRISTGKKPTIVVPCPYEEYTIDSLAKLQSQDLLNVILVGEQSLIQKAIDAAELKIEAEIIEIIATENEKSDLLSAKKSMELIRDHKADILMKGLIDTSLLLGTLLKEEYGLKTGKLFSHVGVLFNPDYPKYFIATDAGMNIAPNLEQKKSIIENAVRLAHCLGNPNPYVAMLCAKEKPYDKMPCTLDAAQLQKMNQEGQITGCIVSGPLQFDNAVDMFSAEIKGVKDPVAGKADILVTPDIEAGNIMGKALMYLGKWEFAGIVEGARIPIVLTSRSSTEPDRLASIALGIMMV